MEKLIIVGTGAVAAEMTCYIEDTVYGGQYGFDIQGYLCINSDNHKKYGYKKPYLGHIADYQIQSTDKFIIAIGDNHYRKQWADFLMEKNACIVNLIHPTCIVAPNITLGIGNIFYPYSQIGPLAKVGNFNTVTCFTIVSHDCCIGDFNDVFGFGFCGHVQVGDNNVFGVGSIVIPKINIGNQAKVQAGMIVDKDVADDTTVFHRFKEKIIAIPKPTDQ